MRLTVNCISMYIEIHDHKRVNCICEFVGCHSRATHDGKSSDAEARKILHVCTFYLSFDCIFLMWLSAWNGNLNDAKLVECVVCLPHLPSAEPTAVAKAFACVLVLTRQLIREFIALLHITDQARPRSQTQERYKCKCFAVRSCTAATVFVYDLMYLPDFGIKLET